MDFDGFGVWDFGSLIEGLRKVFGAKEAELSLWEYLFLGEIKLH